MALREFAERAASRLVVVALVSLLAPGAKN
jgi:hypothetical protein